MDKRVSKIGNILRRISLCRDWYKIVFPVNRFIAKEQVLHLRNGTSIVVGDIFSSDIPVLVEIFVEKSYPLHRLSLPHRPSIVDVGANIGAFSLAAKNTFPDADIIAFEPSARNFALLKRNLPGARVEEKAVVGRSGEVRLQDHGNHTGLNVVKEGGVPVEALSLEDALRDLPKVDLLKVDIESSEYDVFSNTSPATLQKINNVIIEVHKTAQRPWFTDFFIKNGFAVEWHNEGLLLGRKIKQQ